MTTMIEEQKMPRDSAELSAAAVLSEQTPRAIAASVAKSRRLLTVEGELLALRQRREALGAEQSALMDRRDDWAATRRINELEAARRTVEAEIKGKRIELEPLRITHRAAVRVALLPVVRDAAARALLSLQAAQAISQTVLDAEDCLVRLGDPSARRTRIPSALGELEHQLALTAAGAK